MSFIFRLALAELALTSLIVGLKRINRLIHDYLDKPNQGSSDLIRRKIQR